MFVYLGQRILVMTLLLVVMSILVFCAIHVLPGNVAILILGDSAAPEHVAALEAKLGLNDPLHVQYWRWASMFVTGDFGESLVMERPIAPIVMEALGKSLVLASCTLLIVALVGITLGVISATRRGSIVDHGASLFAYLGISVPEFFWGIVLIIVCVNYLGLLPASGNADISDGIGNYIAHLILPIATLTLTLLAHVSRMTRSSVIEELESNYVKAARAKGLPERIVLFRHALRNGLLPTITVLAYDFGWLIGGIVVVETVFSYPGVGRLLIFAIERHDLPLVQAIVILMTAIYMGANLVADLLYTCFNPKLRYGGAVE